MHTVALKPPLGPSGVRTLSPSQGRGGAKLRARSSSAGRGPDKGLRARYWAYLFENLRRAVDEIYQTCETDESVLECREAMMVLGNYSKEFKALIDWIELSKELENTPPPNRPACLAWEVRKPNSGRSTPRSLGTFNQQPRQLVTVGTQSEATLPVIPSSSDSAESGSEKETSPAASDCQAGPQGNIFISKVAAKHAESPEQAGQSTEAREDATAPKNDASTKEPTADEEPSSETAVTGGSEAGTSDTDSPPVIPTGVTSAKEEAQHDITVSAEATTEEIPVSSTVNGTKAASTTTTTTAADVVTSTTSTTATTVTTTSTTSPATKGSDEPKAVQATKTAATAVSAAASTNRTAVSAKPSTPKVQRPSTSLEVKTRTTHEAARHQPHSYYPKLTASRSPSAPRQAVPRTSTGASPVSRPSPASSTSSNATAAARRPPSAVMKAQPPSCSVPSQSSALTLPLPGDEQPPTLKDSQKSGSSSCLSFKSTSSTSSCRSWADKVRGGTVEPEVARSTSLDPITIDEDDTEGWETVCRSKARSRNSPPKKTHPRPSAPAYPSGVSRSPSAPSINLSTTSSAKTRWSSAPMNPRNSSGGVVHSKVAHTKLGIQSQNAKSLPSLAGKREERTAKRDQRGCSERRTVPSVMRSQSFIGSTKRGGTIKTQKAETNSKEHSTKQGVARSKSFVGPCRTEKGLSAGKAREPAEEPQKSGRNKKDDEIAPISKVDEDMKEAVPDTDGALDEDGEDDLATRDEAELVHDLGLSWGDQMDCLDLELRIPGRALQMHEKLSSATRKRPLSETLQRNREKQAKAQEQRERIREEKAQRCRDYAKKVEEKKALQEEQQNQRRLTIEKRLQRAAEKREMALKSKVKKAHDEEEKVNEIAFINTLEAQNKRIDIMSKEKDHEARLQDIQEERQRKLEEKAAKEAAAEERRKVLEAERQAKLLEIREKRKLKDEKVQQQQQEKEKQRQILLRQKEREREQRLSALTAAQLATAEELQKKIQLKQEESARRHEENMEQIRHKAFELSVRKCSSNTDDAPRLVPYETKKICSLCNVIIGSELYLLSHLRGKMHQEAVKENHQGMAPSTEELESYNLKHIVDAPADRLDPEIMVDKERQKAQKKRCKKLRQKMSARGKLYEKVFAERAKTIDSKNRFRIVKFVKEVNRCLNNQGVGPWDPALVSSLDRALGELERTLDRGTSEDKDAFRLLGGFSALGDLLGCILKSTVGSVPVVPARCLIRACTVLRLASSNCYASCEYLLFSNRVALFLDMVGHRLNILIPEGEPSTVTAAFDSSGLRADPVASALLHLLRVALEGLTGGLTGAVTSENAAENIRQRLLDVLSYAVSVGTVDKVAQNLISVRGPVDSEPEQLTEFLVNCLDFVACLARLLSRCNGSSDSGIAITDGSAVNNAEQTRTKKGSVEEEGTHLVGTFRVTELVGAVSLLYGTLLHSGAPSRSDTPPPPLPTPTLSMAMSALQLLNQLARLDLGMFQTVLGAEGMSLQLRHIASYLLWYTNHWELESLLHEVILLLGYFAVLSPDNQMVIQSGECPTLLQILCTLPFEYFSDPRLTTVLLPTLVACCYGNLENRAILEQELSPVLLANFIEECLLDLHCGKKKATTEEEHRWSLESRFPKSRWTSAKTFFSVEANGC